MTVKKDCVIVGSGISGLAIAFRLKKAGLDVCLLEKSPRVGGSILTEKQDGFLIDCGPNSTLETSPKIGDFVKDVGLAAQKIYASDSAKNRYILRNGILNALPMSPPAFLISKLFSWKAKLRLFAEPFIAPAPEDKEETIAEFVKRRLGQEFLDYAINPFIAGVYAGDPEKLSVRSAVAKIYALEKNYGSLIKGAIKGAKARKKRTETDKTRAQLFSFKNGMAELVHAISAKIAETILTSTEINQITKISEREYAISVKSNKIEKIIANSVIFTTPAFATADFIQSFDTVCAGKLREIHYPPVAMVFFGFKNKNKVQCRPLDGFGFLVPKVEKRKILGTIWSSTLFPNRAPAGGIALTTFVGGMRQPEVLNCDDEALSNLVRSELADLLNLKGKPDIVKIKRWERAIPQYALGHQQRIDAIEQLEKNNPGLFLSGNYRGGISVGDCILQSEVVANLVIESVKKQEKSKVTVES